MGPSQESARESSRTNSNTKDPLPQKGAITIMMDPPQLQMEDFHQLLRISMPQSNNLRRVRLCLSKPKTTVTACSLPKMLKQRRTDDNLLNTDSFEKYLVFIRIMKFLKIKIK